MAGSSAGSIFVDLLLRDANFVSGLNRSRNNTKGFSVGVSGDLKSVSKAFADVLNPVKSLGSAVLSLGSIFAASLSIQKIVAYSDAWKGLQSRLSLVTKTSEEAFAITQKLFGISQNTAQPITEVVGAYTRLSNSLSDAQKQQYDMVRITDLLSKTLVISGTNAEGAATFFQQFGQAATSDFKAVGQEIQTFADQNSSFYKILVQYAATTGKSLKQLAADGELSFSVIADALLKAQTTIDEQSGKISLTVGRSLTELANAFLKFVGTNETVIGATTALAGGIQLLAQNIDTLGKIVIIAAGALATVFITSMIRSAAAMVTAFIAANAFNLAIGEIAFGSRAAALGMVVLSRSLITLRAGLAALGGPIGIAFLAVLTLASFHTDQATVAQEKYNQMVGDTQTAYSKYASASADARKKTDDEANARIQKIKQELLALQGLVNTYAEFSTSNPVQAFGMGLREGLGKLGIGEAPSENIRKYEAAQKAIDDINKSMSEGQTAAAAKSNAALAGNSKEIDKWLLKQREGLITLQQEADYMGKTSIEIDKLKDARKFETEVAEKAYGLKGAALNRFKSEAASIQEARQALLQYNYELSRKASTGAEEFFAQYSEDATNSADNIKKVLQDAFQGAEDALVNFVQTGKLNFKDLANSIIEDLLRIQIKKGFASAASALFGGSDSGGASSPGLLSGLLDSAGSSLKGIFSGWFADGGFIPPGQFGIAGEAGAEVVMGGKSGATVIPQSKMGGGGNSYVIDAKGADSGTVLRLQKALLALAGPGVIEQRVVNAQTRGKI